jgi:glycosyltransferase involved in cell wall biosynthesis
MRKSKKILHIITSLGNGGAEKNLLRLCLGDKINQNIIVTLKENNFYSKILKEHGIIVINLNILSNPIIALKKLISIIKNKKPGVIMGWMYHPCFLITLISKFIDRRIKKIWNIRHSSVIFFKTKILTFILVRYVLVFFSNLPNLIIFNSFHSQKVHISYGFKNPNINVIHNGFKRQSFRNKNINKRLNLGFIGRYSPQKNFNFLFEIISFLKKKNFNFKFYFIGSNVNIRNKELISHINKYDIKDKIIFLKTKTDISNYFNLFDATVSTSVYGESFPNILAESLLSSTPCIATNFGENKLILKKGGLIYKKNNINDFYSKLKKILNLRKNKKNWTYFRKEGYYHIINEFSDKKMLTKYLKIY